MKRIVIIFITITLFWALVNSCPAYPGRIAVVEGNDTAFISLHGDERMKFAMDDDGFTILPTDEGWMYALADTSGYAIPSSHKFIPGKRVSDSNLMRGLRPRRYLDSFSAQNREKQNNFTPVVGNRRVLVILMQFKDLKFKFTSQDFDQLFNALNYCVDGANGSVRDYYNFVSYGQLDLDCDIVGPYTSQMNMQFYGGNTGAGANDANPYELFREAIENAIRDIDLSDYDSNNDGYVDNVHIIYAGHGEEAGGSPSAIWAHEMTFPAIMINGMKITKYSCAPELRGNMGARISRIGPHCHEIGHALGTMDFYDTDYDVNNYYEGTGMWDIMASGSWNDDGVNPANFNPYTKIYDFGWCKPQILPDNSPIRISPSAEINNIYQVNTGIDGDFFLLENRAPIYTDQYNPGRGLLIFHIGPDIAKRALDNTINARFPQQCYPVCASSTFALPSARIESYGSINTEGCTFPGSSNNRVFSSSSVPAALTVSGHKSDISFTGIELDSDDIVFFNGTVGASEDDPNNGESDDSDGHIPLWRESFENSKWKERWTFESLSNSAVFDVIRKLSHEDKPISPMASHGISYGVFKGGDDGKSFEEKIEGRIVLNNAIELQSGQYILYADVRCYTPSISAVKIQAGISSAGGLISESDFDIASQDVWHPIELKFDVKEQMFIGLEFGFYGQSDCALFLDNILIEQDINSGLGQIESLESATSKCYDIFGRVVNPNAQGFKIRKLSNGKVVKTFGCLINACH